MSWHGTQGDFGPPHKTPPVSRAEKEKHKLETMFVGHGNSSVTTRGIGRFKIKTAEHKTFHRQGKDGAEEIVHKHTQGWNPLTRTTTYSLHREAQEHRDASAVPGVIPPHAQTTHAHQMLHGHGLFAGEGPNHIPFNGSHQNGNYPPSQHHNEQPRAHSNRNLAQQASRVLTGAQRGVEGTVNASGSLAGAAARAVAQGVTPIIGVAGAAYQAGTPANYSGGSYYC